MLRSSEAQKLAQKLRSSKAQKCRSSEAQKLRSSEAQKCRSSEDQKLRSSDAQKLKSSEVQKLTSSQAQKLTSSADEASGYIWQYCLTHKDEVSTLAILDKFEKSIVEYNHVKPKRVYMMSYNGEFASAKVTYACRQAGIMQLLTTPYRSKTNGLVET